MIESNWGGTKIEPWMTREPLDDCDIDDYVDDAHPETSNTQIYNAMIHPLIRLSIKGALWYQGESNSGNNRDKYQCTFPSLITSWRQIWNENSPTSDSFPFGFMQLSTIDAGNTGPGIPVIRWHQTADMGYVPNDIMQVYLYYLPYVSHIWIQI